MKSLIIIPSRMQSSRLPNKPLADIEGKPMIIRVFEQAKKAQSCDVIVACDGLAIQEVVHQAGGKAIITPAELPSGTDRIYDALCTYDPSEQYDIIINVQGDLPLIDPQIINKIRQVMISEPDADIVTPVAQIHDANELASDAVVKVAVDINDQGLGRALYFSRCTIPWGKGPIYHHIGIYGYRRASLQKFINYAPSGLEKRESLEQLRALENGMNIIAVEVDKAPLGVDRLEDLETVRKWVKNHG